MAFEWLVRSLLVGLLLLLAASPLRAQSSLQIPLQFDFLNPGARSLALGGAFTGLADDATAALANPAGLTFLLQREASIEGRGRRFTQPFLERGRLSGPATGIGEDTVGAPVFAESVDTSGSLSFVSAVFPCESFAISVYRHELVKLSESFESRGVFQRPENFRELAFDALRELSISNYGVAAGYRVSPKLRVGAGLSIYGFDLRSRFVRFGHDGFFGPPDRSFEFARFIQDGSDVAVGVNVGALVEIHPKVRLGASYRRGPAFDFHVEFSQLGQPTERRPGDLEFRVPDTLALGIVVRPIPVLTLSGEYTRVQYSRIVADFVDVQTEGSARSDRFTIADGNEVHLGVEYVLVDVPGRPALRAGTWYDPDHTVKYDPTPLNDVLDERLAVALSSGESLVHATFGGGISLGVNLEINGAVDLASRTRLFVTSAVVRF